MTKDYLYSSILLSSKAPKYGCKAFVKSWSTSELSLSRKVPHTTVGSFDCTELVDSVDESGCETCDGILKSSFLEETNKQYEHNWKKL